MSTVDQKAKTTTVPGYHPVTRWLHAGLVLGVAFQLICAAQMAHPGHADGGHDGHDGAMTVAGSAPVHHLEHVDSVDVNGSSHVEAAHIEGIHMNVEPQHAMVMKKDVVGEWWMGAHRIVGVLVALIVLVNLIWAMMLRGNPRKRQIGVLFSALHWAEAGVVLKYLPLMLLGKKPLPEPGNALSLIVEMLGMLTMTAMAVSGSIIWGMWAGPGNQVSAMAEIVMEAHAGVAILLFCYLAGHISMALMHARAGDPVFARILPRLNG